MEVEAGAGAEEEPVALLGTAVEAALEEADLEEVDCDDDREEVDLEEVDLEETDREEVGLLEEVTADREDDVLEALPLADVDSLVAELLSSSSCVVETTGTLWLLVAVPVCDDDASSAPVRNSIVAGKSPVICAE